MSTALTPRKTIQEEFADPEIQALLAKVPRAPGPRWPSTSKFYPRKRTASAKKATLQDLIVRVLRLEDELKQLKGQRP